MKIKNKELLKTTKNKTENIKEVTDFIKEPLSLEAKNLMEKIRTIEKNADYKKLKITDGNKITYELSDFKALDVLLKDFRSKKMTIDEAEIKQGKFNRKLLI